MSLGLTVEEGLGIKVDSVVLRVEGSDERLESLGLMVEG